VYGGVPVFGAELRVHLTGGLIISSVSGNYVRSPQVALEPRVNENAAREAAVIAMVNLRAKPSVGKKLPNVRDLPRTLYHIQWKFRDEVRPRFGVMRGREFLMKDNYSFDLDKAGATRSYNRMFVAYLRTFARMGLKAIPMRAETGPIGGDLSHEFIVLAETSRSGVFCNAACSTCRSLR
jgi:hypothetical protein